MTIIKARKKIKISVFSFSLFLFFVFLMSAQAQTAASKPEFMFSWKADSYVPAWYSGVVFPTKGSRVEASFELVDSGKIVDISKNKIRWYVNDDLRKNEDDGLGIKNLNFTVTDYPGEDIEIRIAIFDYKSAEGIKEIGKIVKIPIVNPEVVIDAPYPNAQIPSGSNSFHGYPFFFNIKGLTDVSFGWTVNNRITEGEVKDSDILNLKIDSLAPSGFDVKVGLLIKNLLNEMEFAGGSVNLKLK